MPNHGRWRSVFEGVGEYGVSMNYFAIVFERYGTTGTSRHVGHVREITYEVNPGWGRSNSRQGRCC